MKQNKGVLAFGLVNFLLTLAWTIGLGFLHFNLPMLIFAALSSNGVAVYISMAILVAGLLSTILCLSGGARACGEHRNAKAVTIAALLFQIITLTLLCVWMYLCQNGWAMFVSNWELLIPNGVLSLFTFCQVLCTH